MSHARSTAVLAILAILGGAATGALAAPKEPTTPAATGLVCSGNPTVSHRIDYTVAGHRTFALYAVPAHRARGLVLFDHGYTNTPYSWVTHMRNTVEHDGVIAITPDYHGQVDFPPAKGSTLPSSRGWRVAEGAQDTLYLARLFEAACGLNGINAVYGVSMGGNTAGLVAMAGARRPNGSPLFTYVFLVEPAVNVTETYHEASAIAPTGNAFAADAKADIAQEMGGTPTQQPNTYAARTVVLHATDIAAAGYTGVAVVQGVDDGLVPYNQSREMVAELHALRVPVEDVTVTTRGSGEPGTTLTGNAPIPGYTSPFAGHGSEGSNTQPVIMMGFRLLDATYAGHFGCAEGVSGATFFTTVSDPC